MRLFNESHFPDYNQMNLAPYLRPKLLKYPEGLTSIQFMFKSMISTPPDDMNKLCKRIHFNAPAYGDNDFVNYINDWIQYCFTKRRKPGPFKENYKVPTFVSTVSPSSKSAQN